MDQSYDTVAIRYSTLITMAFSAIEVFPKECMGGMLAKKGKIPLIAAAVPYQIAKRTKESVETESSPKLSNMGVGHLYKIGDFHSHPFEGKKDAVPLTPSEYDFETTDKGELDLIIRVMRARSNKRKSLCMKGLSISMSEGRFRILIRAYYRDEKEYKKIKINLIQE